MRLNFKNFTNKLNYYFRDIYGIDKLSKYLVIGGMIFSLSRYTYFLGILLSIIGLYRAFSKNKSKRYQELAAFENLIFKLRHKFYSKKSSVEQRKNFKILTCPKCSQKLRIPRKQGKITVICKKCGHEFKSKS